ncbi:MAG TPA: HEAT repeat domain-containing protein, partial [Polyangia bacterium]|nr:HEAT repeat domain-containing protein [Polyangia bacterium]
ELDRVRTEEATKFLVRLLKRPFPSVQTLAAQMLIKRRAVSSLSALKPLLDPANDPALRQIALVAADAPALAAADPKLGLAVYRAYLGRGERDLAGNWWVAHASALPPSDQTDALLDWIDTRTTGAAMARGGNASAPGGEHGK